jgi:hypothetical protein
MTVVINYVVTCLYYHICDICLSLSCHQHVILSQVPYCSWFSRINPGGFSKIVYIFILTIHDYYCACLIRWHIDFPFESAFIWICPCDRTSVVVHVTGYRLSFLWQGISCYACARQQLQFMWQDNRCRACDRTTVVVHVAGQQLSCMWQDNSFHARDRTTVVVRVIGQQLFLWQDNSCHACDRTTVVVRVTGQDVLVTGQQWSCMWQDIICPSSDSTTVMLVTGQEFCLW